MREACLVRVGCAGYLDESQLSVVYIVQAERGVPGMKTQVKSGRYVRSHTRITEVLRIRPHLLHFTPASH